MIYTVTIEDFEFDVRAYNWRSAEAQAQWAWRNDDHGFGQLADYGVEAVRYVGAWA